MRKWPAILAILTLWGCTERTRPAGADLQSPSPAELPLDPKLRLEALVRENLDAELSASPTTATWLGAHAWDDKLDDVRLEAQGREVARLRALLEKLKALDALPGAGELDPARRLDRQLLERRAQSTLFDLTELRPLEHNPATYVDLAQAAIFELLADDFLPVPDRLRAIIARLWKLRPLFDEARRNLRGVPELSVRRAIEMGQAARSFLAETLPKAVQLHDAKLMDELRAADGDATRALDDFVGWLSKDLLPRAKGDFAIGRDKLAEKLRLSDAISDSPEELAALGEREIKKARARWDALAASVPVDKAGKPVDLHKLIEDDHGKSDDLTGQVNIALEGMVGFVRVNHLLPLPEPERPKVADLPPAQWGFLQLAIGGPLERPREPLLYLDPIDKAWPDRRKQEHLRAFNRPTMLLTLAHDVVGHYVAAERNRRAPTTLQKLALAGTMVEGFPHYVERMLVDCCGGRGYGADDLKWKLMVERSALVRAARLTAVVRLHALGARLDDVVKLFTDEANLDDYTARREAERAATDPLILLDTLGRVEIERLRDDWMAAHANATLGEFHEALLAHGSVPVRLLRPILLPK